MQKKRSWSSAHLSCVEMGPGHDLASIKSQEEQRFLVKYIGNFNSKIWIGLNDKNRERRFGWSNNNPLRFTDWADNEPGRVSISRCFFVTKPITGLFGKQLLQDMF